MCVDGMTYYVWHFRDWIDKINVVDLMSDEELIKYIKFFNDVVIARPYRLNLDFRHKNFKYAIIRRIRLNE